MANLQKILSRDIGSDDAESFAATGIVGISEKPGALQLSVVHSRNSGSCSDIHIQRYEGVDHFNSASMDLTAFIANTRNASLLIGDYGTYRKTLSRRILTLRRKLGRTSPKGKKYVAKTPVSAEDISSNPE